MRHRTGQAINVRSPHLNSGFGERCSNGEERPIPRETIVQGAGRGGDGGGRRCRVTVLLVLGNPLTLLGSLDLYVEKLSRFFLEKNAIPRK